MPYSIHDNFSQCGVYRTHFAGRSSACSWISGGRRAGGHPGSGELAQEGQQRMRKRELPSGVSARSSVRLSCRMRNTAIMQFDNTSFSGNKY